MKRIALQAGHQNIKDNIDPGLRGGTGTDGEVEMTIRIRDRLGQILVAKGFQVFLTDANANGDLTYTSQDYDFFLAIHGEANVHGKGGGFMTAPDPAYDQVNTESRRIIAAIKNEYFRNTGIVEHEEWISLAMTEYYMWNALTAKTPCGIIECGVVRDAHDKVILADTDRVAGAIARGICDAFSVPYDAPQPTPQPMTDYKALYAQAVENSKQLQTQIDQMKGAYEEGNRAKQALTDIKAAVQKNGF